MRIVLIAPPWVAVPPLAYGGTEAVLDSLAQGLVRAGHEVLLYTTGDSTCPVPKAWVLEEAVGVGTAGSATELRHVIKAYDCVLEWQPDIVHDHTLIGPVYADRYENLAVVTTNHGPFDSELGDFYRAIGSRVPVIAISEHQASTAKDTPIAAVIHHGIPTDRYHEGPGDGGYGLFLGRMCMEKGVHTAAAVAKSAGLPLRIAAKLSEPAEHEYFKTYVAPLLGHGIDFIGEIEEKEKIELLGKARCLLNPIDWPEPFGMVIVEALACGTPVVSRPRGSIPELVDDGRTGFLRETNEELAAAIRELDTIDRSHCRADAVERFSVEAMVERHVALYCEVSDRHRRPVRVA